MGSPHLRSDSLFNQPHASWLSTSSRVNDLLCGVTEEPLDMSTEDMASLLPPSSPEAQSAAIDAVASALRLPNFFNFDSLFRVDAVVAAKGHELFSLLQIFLNDGLAQYQQWASSHPDAFSKYGTHR